MSLGIKTLEFKSEKQFLDYQKGQVLVVLLRPQLQASPVIMMKKNIKGHLVYKSFKQLLKVLGLSLTKAESKQKSVPK